MATRPKPRLSKMHKTQKTVSKQTGKLSICYFYFCHVGRLCSPILVQAIDTLLYKFIENGIKNIYP